MSAITIRIGYDVQRVSPNQRLHWAERARRNRVAAAAAVYAWTLAGCPEIHGKAHVDVTIRRGRVMDQDNAVASLKSVLDALCRRRETGCGVLWDDSSKFLELGAVIQETGRRWKDRPEIELCFTPEEMEE